MRERWLVLLGPARNRTEGLALWIGPAGAGVLLQSGYGSILYSHSNTMIGGGFMC